MANGSWFPRRPWGPGQAPLNHGEVCVHERSFWEFKWPAEGLRSRCSFFDMGWHVVWERPAFVSAGLCAWPLAVFVWGWFCFWGRLVVRGGFAFGGVWASGVVLFLGVSCGCRLCFRFRFFVFGWAAQCIFRPWPEWVAIWMLLFRGSRSIGVLCSCSLIDLSELLHACFFYNAGTGLLPPLSPLRISYLWDLRSVQAWL